MDGSSGNATEFLAQHRSRIEAESRERRQSLDAAIEWDENFTQPWNEAWESFESAIESTYSKPGTPETTSALVDAIRRIVGKAKGTDYEKRIRIATERCQRLFREDPTGKAFQLANVADRAAMLTILQACLDGSGEIEQLATELRVTSPHVGNSCRTEVEYAEKMVTVQRSVQAGLIAARRSIDTLEELQTGDLSRVWAEETKPSTTTIPIEQPAGEDGGVGGAETEIKQTKAKCKSNGDTNSKALIIAALNEHHQYSNGECKDVGHAGVNKLARHLEISPSTVSGFFRTEFGGHDKYKIACGNPETLANSLKILNGELKPRILFNSLGDNEGNLADK